MTGDLKEQLSSAQESERAELAKAFRDVFALASGKRVLFWMLEQCAIYQDAYSGDHTNETNYLLGRQTVGRKLIAKLDDIDPRLYPKLLFDIADLKAMDRAAVAAAQQGNDDEEDA